MAIPPRAVKSTAKAALKGHWFKTCCVSIAFMLTITSIFFACALLASVLPEIVVSILLCVLTLFFICPLFLGLIRFFKSLILGYTADFLETFIYFGSASAYKRALRLIFELFVRFIFYAIITFIPAGILKFVTSDLFFSILNLDIPLWIESLNTLLSFLMGMAALSIFILMLRYYLAPFLLVADDDMTVGEAIHMSTILSRRSASELWSLTFSFLGLFFVSLFAIPLIFTLPYLLCALTVHSRYAVTNFNLSINQTPVGFKEDYL